MTSPDQIATAHPVLRDLQAEIRRLSTALDKTRTDADHWQTRAAARGRALRQANEINQTLTRVINEKLNH